MIGVENHIFKEKVVRMDSYHSLFTFLSSFFQSLVTIASESEDDNSRYTREMNISHLLTISGVLTILVCPCGFLLLLCIVCYLHDHFVFQDGCISKSL